MDRYAARRDRVRSCLRREGVPALLVTNFTNVTYLTGFTGDDSCLLVSAGACVLISDGRYRTQIEEECPSLESYIRPVSQQMPEAVAKVVERAAITRLGFEGTSLTVSGRDELAEKLPKVEFVSLKNTVEDLRLCKDSAEIAEIREAVGFAQRAFAMLRAGLQPEMTEKQAADELEHALRRAGAVRASFPLIIAVGDRAALPHARPTQRRVEEGEFVLVDWGASGRLYKSDLTRVLITGRISPKLQKVYSLVLRAQERAIRKIRPGVLARDVDAEARSVIEEGGFGRFFDHGTGHGIGLEIHEAPSLRSTSEVALRTGMVVTVEPGIYLPGWGGVRIEDDVLVTRQGCEVLTSVPKQLEEMVV